MTQERAESSRLLRRAADAVAETAQLAEEPVHVGERGWWQRDPRAWDHVGFLDVIEAEYGLVARYWIVALREVALLAVVFWLAAFTIGLVVDDRQTIGLLGQKVSALSVAVGATVVVRLLVAGVVRLVRARET